VLIVGAGRGGRSLLRELRETPGERVVGFIDDDPGLRSRRLNGVRVFGGASAISTALDRAKPDIVLITIPDAPAARLAAIVAACEAREIACRVVRREIDVDPRAILEPRTR
jgi:FlaA1/EpsC-like NDP-sugar epimerase